MKVNQGLIFKTCLSLIVTTSTFLPILFNSNSLVTEAFTYGSWSSWSTTKPAAQWGREIQTGTEWYYRDQVSYHSTAWEVPGYNRGEIVRYDPELNSNGNLWYRMVEQEVYDNCSWLGEIIHEQQHGYVTYKQEVTVGFWYSQKRTDAGWTMSERPNGYSDSTRPNHCAKGRKYKYPNKVGSDNVQVWDRHYVRLTLFPVYRHWYWTGYTYTMSQPAQIANREIGSRTVYRYRDVVDTTAPTGSCWTANVSRDGYDVYCDVYDENSGIKQVRFPTWTNDGGQDDLKWVTGTLSNQTVNGDGVYSYARAHYRVNRSNWGGKFDYYTTHVYAMDNLNNERSIGSFTVDLRDKTAPEVSLGVTTENWTNQNVEVTVNGWDDSGGSGLATLMYRINGGSWNYLSGLHRFTLSNQGVYTIEAQSQDRSGNWSAIRSKTVRIDKTAPTNSVTLSRDNTWGNTNVTATLYTADSGGSGLQRSQYAMWNDNNNAVVTNWTNYSNGQQITISREGVTRIQTWSKDNAENETYGTSKYIKIDKTNPMGSISVNTENWQNANSVTATLYASDATSGVKAAQYKLSGATTKDWTNYSNGQQITITNEGVTKIEIWVQDHGGNAVYADTKYVRIDRTNPTGSISVNTENWQNVNSVTVTLASGDGHSGVKSATYTLSGATSKGATPYSNGGQITITNQGETTITITVTDNVNRTYTTSKVVRIDRSNPTGDISFNHQNWQNASSVTVILSGSDAVSGNTSIRYKLTGATTQDWATFSNGHRLYISNEGATTITIEMVDKVNLKTTISKTVRIDRTAPKLSSSQNPASWTNQNVNITATATDNIGIWSLNAYNSFIGRYNYLSAIQTKSSGKILIVMHDTAYTDETEHINYPSHLNNFATQLRTLGFTVTTMKESEFTSISQTANYNAIFYLGWAWQGKDSTYSILNTAYQNGIHLFTSGNDTDSKFDIIQSSTQMSGNQKVSKSSNNHLGELVHQVNEHDQGYKKITPISGVKILANVSHDDGTTSPYLIQYTDSNSTQWIHQQGSNEGTRAELICSVANLLLQKNSSLTTSLNHSFTVTENGSYPITAYDFAGNRVTLTHKVTTIDRHNPTGSVVIANGSDFLNNEETTLHIKYNDVVSGNNAASGVYTLKVCDVNASTNCHTITNPSGTSISIPWVLVPWEAPDGALKTQVSVTITDRAGNSITVYSQVVDIIKVYVTDFYLTNVLNPLVYNNKNPFTTLKYPNIPSQPLLTGGHFNYRFDYYHPRNVNSSWKIDYIENVRYQRPNGVETVVPTNRLKQQVLSQFSSQVIIPYDLPKGTKVWLDIQLVLYDQNGRKVAEGYFPQPERTSLLIGTIEEDLRNVLMFNEFN